MSCLAVGMTIYRGKRSQCNVIEAIITKQQGLLLLTGKVNMKKTSVNC